MHVESMEPRQLFAATGLDKRFGDGDGKVELPSRYAVLSLTGAKNVVYAVVADRSTKTQYLYKYDDSGHVDPAFGVNGRATLAFRTSLDPTAGVATIALDRRTRAVYVGFTGSKRTDTVARATLQIERFTAAGDVDTGFGDKGVYSYTDQLRLDPNAGVGFTLNRLQPLAHNQLLIEMDTSERTDNGDGSMFKSTGFTDVQLQRLKYNGRRDATFGRNGIAVAETGYTAENSGDGGGTVSTSAPQFGDLQVLESGRYRVVAIDQAATYRTSDGGRATYTTADVNYYVNSMVIDTSGAKVVPSASGTGVDDASVFRTALSRAKATNSTDFVRFVPMQATADGAEKVQIVGVNTDTGTLMQPGPVGAIGLTVVAGERSTPSVLNLPAKARVLSITHAPDDSRTFVTTTAGTTAFLSAYGEDLTLNTVWGDNGITAGTYTAYFPDDSGALLFTYPGGFGRMDGLWSGLD